MEQVLTAGELQGNFNNWFNKKTGTLTIPNGYTRIKNLEFGHGFTNNDLNYKIKNIVLPNSITDIGENAFSCCEAEEINIPPNVKSIGEGAFSHCWKLKRTTIPESVTKMGPEVFDHCSDLKSVQFDARVTEIEEKMFNECTALEALSFNKSCIFKAIKREAFYGCKSLIGSDADIEYSNGKRLKSLILPSSVNSIEEEAFACCFNLNHVRMPATVETIAENAFFNAEVQAVFVTGNANKKSLPVIYFKNRDEKIYEENLKLNQSKTGTEIFNSHAKILASPLEIRTQKMQNKKIKKIWGIILGINCLVAAIAIGLAIGAATGGLALPTLWPLGIYTIPMMLGFLGLSVLISSSKKIHEARKTEACLKIRSSKSKERSKGKALKKLAWDMRKKEAVQQTLNECYLLQKSTDDPIIT